MAKLGLEQTKAGEGIAEVQAKALLLKNDPLALFPMELPLTRPTGPSVATVGLDMAWGVDVMAC
mgnify:CR=1 FL=1